MKYLATLFFLVSATTCLAKKSSRLIFFRMDAKVSDLSKSAQADTIELLRNGIPIAKLGPASVFMFDTDSIQGTYSFRRPGNTGLDNSIRLTAYKSVLGFIKIHPDEHLPKSAKWEYVDFKEFQHNFYHNRLYKQLEAIKQYSFFDLVDGYNVFNSDGIPLNRLRMAWKRILYDTTFFNKYDILVADDRYAAYYSILTKDSKGFTVTDCHMPGGELKDMYQIATPDSQSKHGTYVSFYRSGRVSARGKFENNIKKGRWSYYYDTTDHPLWYLADYNNKLSIPDTLRSYYISGNLKREEFHKQFKENVTHYEGRFQRDYLLTYDSVVEGRCYDEDGSPMAYTPFESIAVQPSEMSQLLHMKVISSKFPAPTLEDVEIKMKFTINALGKVEDVIIIKSASEDIDKEMLSFERGFSNWQPATRDDAPISSIFNFSYTFYRRR